MKNYLFSKHGLILTTLLVPLFSYAQFGNRQILNESLSDIAKIIPVDYDGDGDIDLIVSSLSGTKLVFYENIGNDSLSSQNTISINAGTIINITDVDNDGKIDLLACINGDIGWYKNYGNNSFTDFRLITSGYGGAYPTDIDNDGDNDIFVTIPDDNKISWFENNGSGNFGTENIVTTTVQNLADLKIVDIDNDGYNDLIVSEINNSMNVDCYHNDGSTNFSIINILANAANNLFPPKLIDYNNDGLKDLVWGSGALYWNRNLGNCNFNSSELLSSIICFVFNTYDFNNDGIQDFVFGADISGNPFRICQGLSVIQSYYYYQTSNFYYGSNDITFCDFNNDGYIDIIEGLNTGRILWYKNDSTNHFHPPIALNKKCYSPDNYFYLDYDNDSLKDILVSYKYNNYVSIFRNTGNSQFSSEEIILDTTNNAQYMKITDIDNDNDYDITYISNSNPTKNLYILKNNNSQWDSTIINNIRFYNLADINKNGFIDIVYLSDTTLYMAFNDGNGNFDFQSSIEIYNMPAYYFYTSNVYITNVDNDNDNDIIMDLLGGGGSQIIWLENDGSFNFTSHSIDTTNITPDRLQICDFNNDSNIDITYISDEYQYTLLLQTNDGYGNFTRSDLFTLQYPHDFNFYRIEDVNNDGYKDFICNLDNENIYWYENINNTIQTQGNFISDGSLYPFSMIDIDKDGTKDLLYINQSWNEIGWKKNYVNYPFKISGNFFFDVNQNGIKDSLEPGFLHSEIQISPTNLASYTDQSGYYWAAVTIGNYEVSYNPVPYWNLSTPDSSYNVSITTNNPIKDSCNFGFYPDTIVTDMQADLTFDYGMCNNFASFWIYIKNTGTTLPHGIIKLQLDSAVSFYNSQLSPDSIVNNNIYWHFNNINYFEEKAFWTLTYWVPPSYIGDSLYFKLDVCPLDSLNNTIATFSDSTSIIITCAYDPNKKTVDPIGNDTSHYISNNQELEYTIHFQNTGNDTAINIVIIDTLSSNLNDSTFEFISSSFPCRIFKNNKILHFEFDSIMLPDSNTNEIESHGFLKYTIKPLAGLYPNIQITNKADIYFDYNSSITTNTTLNTIECWLTPSIPTISYTAGNLSIFGYSNDIIQWYLNDTIIPNATDTFISPQWTGQYSVIVTNQYGCSEVSDYFNYVVNIKKNNFDSELIISPNPTTGILFIESTQTPITEIKITDITGKAVKEITGKSTQLQINLQNEPAGIYFVTVKTKENSVVKKVVLEK